MPSVCEIEFMHQLLNETLGVNFKGQKASLFVLIQDLKVKRCRQLAHTFLK